MKLIIQIPCYNEETTLPEVIRDLPREIKGIGSSDNTIAIAKELGVHHILELGSNRGLAKAFSAGIDYALSKGADIVVNTDGDNQYQGADIEKLVQPILRNRSDIVVGARPIVQHTEFSIIKKFFQLLGSWMLRQASKTNVKDAPSGFRAFSKEACLRMFIYSKFSYTMENLIQAGNSNMRVVSVDIRVNKKTRESRLFGNMFEHMYKSGSTMLLMYVLYRPGRFFFWIGSIVNSIALLLGLRFLYLVFFADHTSSDRTYIPSLILLAILAFLGILSYMMGIIGELLKATRRQNEEIIVLQRRNNLQNQNYQPFKV
jgi:glycosyltransferase involved in cell wall biosynthesis